MNKQIIIVVLVGVIAFLVGLAFILSVNRPDPQMGRLVIETTPEGARLLWDGQDIEGSTPITLENLRPGKHLLTIRKTGYDEFRKSVQIEAGKLTREDITLRELRGMAILKTEPSGAEVKTVPQQKDQTPVLLGYTPLLLLPDDLPYGTNILALRKDGFDPVNIPVRVESRVPQLINLELKTRFASIKVNTVPEGAKVFLNGEYIGLTPVARNNVLEGSYELTVQKEGFDDRTETILIQPRTEFVRDYELVESPSALEIESRPSGANVFLNDKKVGVTPLKLSKLKAGNYNVRLTLRKYLEFEKEITLEAGKTSDLVANLEKNTGKIQLQTSPPEAQIFVDKELVGTSKPDRQRTDLSEMMEISDVQVGTVVVEVVKPKYQSVSKNVLVEKDKITNLDLIQLEQFDDTEVIFKNGMRWTGVILHRFPNGDIELSRRAGSRGGRIITTIKASEIQEIRAIGAETPK